MQRCYFDHNATTPVDPLVVEAMLPALREAYGNASSIHTYGQDARRMVEQARRQVAGLLGCAAKEVVFTSGGTEGDNLAVFGIVRRSTASERHVITTDIEHPAVLQACGRLEAEGAAVTRLPVDAQGLVDPDEVRAALRPETLLVSVMAANNELGTIQPISEIARISREAGVALHTDGVQATGKLEVDVTQLDVDLFALSGHKFYAPKGVGALYVRKGVELDNIQFGGSHERGLRPGTENVPAIVGLGAAAEIARRDLASEAPRLAQLRDRLENAVLERIGGCRVNGGQTPRTPNTTNIQFDHIEGEALVIALDLKGFAISSGAACSSGAVKPSHVLTAIGLSAEQARSSLRFSLGKQTTQAQIEGLVEALAVVVERLRQLSPVA